MYSVSETGVTTITAADAETLFRETIRGFVYHEIPGMQVQFNANSGKAWVNDVEFRITNPTSKEFNLCLSGYNFPGRWSKFFTEYTQAEPFAEFLARCKMLQATQINGYTCAQRNHHNLGNCLHAVNYRPPGPGQAPQVNMYGRSSLFSPVGVVDIGFGLAIIKWIKENSRQRVRVDDFSLVWRTTQVQVMTWKLIVSLRLLGIIKHEDELPNTQMGIMLKSHIKDARNGTLPTLTMFSRQGLRYLEMEASGYFENPPVFYPVVPATHTPDFVGKLPLEEKIDYELEWVEDMQV